MEKWQPVAEEYKAAFENYKVTFDHAANLSKYYAGIVLVILAGLSAKAVSSNGIADLIKVRGWIIAVLSLLLAVGAISLVVLRNIVSARFKCIKRMNYLRGVLLGDIDGFDYQAYLSVCGFKNPSGSNTTALAHGVFILGLVGFVLASIIWVMMWS